MLKYILIVCTLLSISLQAPAQNTKEEWTSISTDGFSVQYPADWTPDQSGQMGTKFFLFSPKTSPDDKFNENVNLLVQDLSGYNLTLKQYTQISEKQLTTYITNGKIIESKTFTKDDQKFQRVIYTGTMGTFNLKFEQLYFLKDNKAYLLTLTCEESQYDAYKERGRKILNSFALENN